MARIALLASLLAAVATLPARAQSSYSEPPLPGDGVEAWADPVDDPEDLPDEEVEGEDAADENVPGAAAGPANEEEARAFEAYLRELESQQEGVSQDEGAAQELQTEIPEDDAPARAAAPAPAPPAAPVERAQARAVDDGRWVAQNPYFSITMDAGTRSRSGGHATIVDAALRFEGDRGGLLISLGGRNQTWVTGGVERTADYSVFALEPTFAVIRNQNFRWRLRGGWSVAGNDRVSMSGISLGSSMVLHVAGPLDFEVDVHVTPFPFLRAEAKVAAALHFGVVSLRLGWMGSDISDQGWGMGSGSPIRTRYSGVYLGAGLHF